MKHKRKQLDYILVRSKYNSSPHHIVRGVRIDRCLFSGITLCALAASVSPKDSGTFALNHTDTEGANMRDSVC